MDFILYPDPRLSQAAAPAELDDDLRSIGGRLLATATKAKAYGLAAAHIGEVAPVIVINFGAPSGPTRYELLYNPRIEAVAPEAEPRPEGSVSLPGIEVEITRPVWAELSCEDGSGAIQRMRLEGFLARCALHEIEQMQGKFFLSNLSRLKRDMVLRKYEKSRRGLI